MSSKRLSRLAIAAPLLASALVLFAVNPGCATSCSNPETGDAEEFRGGTTDATRSTYESAPWRGTYLRFRPEKQYKFFHGLRGTPSLIQVWVGFDEAPLSSDPGNISEAAGNEAIVSSVTDQSFTVRNDTCETFYVRVVATDPIEDASVGGAPSTGTGGVGADDAGAVSGAGGTGS